LTDSAEETPRPDERISAQLSPGEIVDQRFVLGSLLGRGASGTVYAAVDRDSGDDVALKLIHRHLVTDRQIRQRFFREASILSRLRSEHLVALRAFGEHAGLLYMALDLCRGVSLEALILQERTFSATRAVDVLLQISRALEDAHASGVIHRDLKPANVMIESTEGGGDRVRVLDFGMSKVLKGEAPGATVLTEENMVFGTPEYMSPEQARGDELDATCDVYAAGTILYELLTGKVPFSGPNPIATMTAHLVEPVEPPSVRAPGRRISKALETVVMCALHKHPRDRYPSAHALGDALEHAALYPEDMLSVRPSAQASQPPPSSSPSGVPRGLRRAAGIGQSLSPPLVSPPSSLPPSSWPPSSWPPPSSPLTSSGTEEAAILSPLGWAVVALLAAGVGIGIGVWISLRP
jgi:serine/threonine protein kinase